LNPLSRIRASAHVFKEILAKKRKFEYNQDSCKCRDAIQHISKATFDWHFGPNSRWKMDLIFKGNQVDAKEGGKCGRMEGRSWTLGRMEEEFVSCFTKSTSAER
jgi:hypothetical protein